MFSHHSHSGQFCRHAEGTLEEVVLAAIEQGFITYGLTEHVPRYRESDFYPEEVGMTLESLQSQFEAFLTEAHRLKAAYASRITLLVGLETEYITSRDLDELEALLHRHGDRIEYLVGSVHHVNEVPIDFDQPTYEKALATTDADLSQFLCDFFDAQFGLLQRFKPEVIGHIDLCRLYSPSLVLSDFPLAWEKLQRNICYATEYGALFELNAAAFRKGWTTAYPGEDVVKLIQAQNGKFTLSDDSHGPSRVGLNYDKLVAYVRRIGITTLWYLSPSPNGSGRKVNVTKVDESWWEKHIAKVSE